MRYTVAAPGSPIKVGTRVYCALYGGSDGIVYKVTPGNEPMRTIGHIGTTGGESYDVVFPDHLSRQVPEGIVRGVQWEVYEEVASADEIVEAISAANAAKERAAEVERENAARRAEERVKHAADNPHLLKKSDKPDWSEARLVAHNVRIELKKRFPKTKFRVQVSGNGVNVGWTDGPTTQMVKEFTARHEHGSFDGMTDMYNYDPDATFSDVFGGVNYVSENRDATTEGVRYAWVNGETVNKTVSASLAWGAAEDVTENWRSSDLAESISRTWRATDLSNVTLTVAV